MASSKKSQYVVSDLWMPCPVEPSKMALTDDKGDLQTGYEEPPNDSSWAQTSKDDLAGLGLSGPEEYYKSFSGVSLNGVPEGDTEIGEKEASEDFNIVDELYVFLTQDEVCADVILQLEPDH